MRHISIVNISIIIFVCIGSCVLAGTTILAILFAYVLLAVDAVNIVNFIIRDGVWRLAMWLC